MKSNRELNDNEAVNALALELRKILEEPYSRIRVMGNKTIVEKVQAILDDPNSTPEVLMYADLKYGPTANLNANTGKNALHLAVDLATRTDLAFDNNDGSKIVEAILNSKHCTEDVFKSDKMSAYGNPVYYAVAARPNTDRQHDVVSQMLRSPKCPESVITDKPKATKLPDQQYNYHRDLISLAIEKNNSTVLDAILKSRHLSEQRFYDLHESQKYDYFGKCLNSRERFPCLAVILSNFRMFRPWAVTPMRNALIKGEKTVKSHQICDNLILDQLFDLAMNDIRRSPCLRPINKNDDILLRFDQTARSAYRHAGMLEKCYIVEAMLSASKYLSTFYWDSSVNGCTQYIEMHHSIAKPLAQALMAIVCLGVVAASVAVAVSTLGIAAIPMVAPLCAALGTKALAVSAVAGAASTYGAYKCTQFAANHVRENEFCRELQAVCARK